VNAKATQFYEKGNRFFNGRETARDVTAAPLWWRRAADEGGLAMYSIGSVLAWKRTPQTPKFWRTAAPGDEP
jgi:TPR repeat protein